MPMLRASVGVRVRSKGGRVRRMGQGVRAYMGVRVRSVRVLMKRWGVREVRRNSDLTRRWVDMRQCRWTRRQRCDTRGMSRRPVVN